MYTKTVFVPCTIGAICLHFFFQASKGKWKVRWAHWVCVSLSMPTLSLPLLT